MKTILHISCDFPDLISQKKTKAVYNLVSNASNFKHIVISLNRTANPLSECVKKEGGLYSVGYWGLPYGVLLKTCLIRTAERLFKMIKAHEIHPTLIHCHKLSFEGIIGYYLAKKLSVPYACTVRGDTDLKLIKYKKSYHEHYKKIIASSSALFFLAPWTLHRIKQWYGQRWTAQTVMLPNIVSLSLNDESFKHNVAVKKKFVTVCHLDSYRRKNLFRIIRAMDRVCDSDSSIELDIIGGGKAKSVKLIGEILNKAKHTDRFHLLGSMSNTQVSEKLGSYAGLVLPSYPETFGMVYLEALSAGIPIIHTKEQGVDGYFNDYDVSISVAHRSEAEISDAIERLCLQQNFYRDKVSKMIKAGGLLQFKKDKIITQYERVMKGIS